MVQRAHLPEMSSPRSERIPAPGAGRPEFGLQTGGGASFAALDLGTNNCRLMIATPAGRDFRVVDSFSRIVRLGEGLQEFGILGDAAMDRTIAALRACAARLARHRVRAFRAVATEACRRAANGPQFLERVRAETGLTIEIIAPREEAELALESCAALLQPAIDQEGGGPQGGAQEDGTQERSMQAGAAHSRGLLFDIGGGSTEIAWVRLSSGTTRENPAQELIGYHSLPFGVITLAESFGPAMFEPDGYEAMVAHVAAELEMFERIHCIGREIRAGRVRLLGTSGTVTTLASVAMDLPRYRRALVDGVTMSREAAADAVAQLRRAGRGGLAAHRCVGPSRAAHVLPGCAIFEAIHRLWPTEMVTVADRGLRDGILLRMMREAAGQSARRGRQATGRRRRLVPPPDGRQPGVPAAEAIYPADPAVFAALPEGGPFEECIV